MNHKYLGPTQWYPLEIRTDILAMLHSHVNLLHVLHASQYAVSESLFRYNKRASCVRTNCLN